MAESVLKPSTPYTLYGMKNGETTVSKLLSFTTDATSTLGGGTSSTTRNETMQVDTTLEKGHITIAVNSSELYIFPVQMYVNPLMGSTVSGFSILSSSSNIDDWVIISTTIMESTTPDAAYNKILYMATKEVEELKSLTRRRWASVQL